MSIQSLQDAFAYFCVDAVDGKDLLLDKELAPATHRTRCVREFSQVLVNSSKKLDLSKIYNQWLLLCQEFAHNPETLSDTGASRLKKIGSRLLALSETAPQPADKSAADKSAAEEIADLVADAHIKTKHVEEYYSDEVKALARSYPKAMNAIETMFQRISRGVYGQHVKKQLYDALKSPILREERFGKMLFVDLTVRGLDPHTSCEWFAKCLPYDVIECTFGILDMKEKLQKEYGLPEKEVLGSLMAKSNYFDAKLKPQFENVSRAFGAEYSQATHKLLLDRYSHLYKPTNKVLTSIAGCLAGKQKVSRALKVLSYVQGPNPERKKYFDVVVRELFHDNEDQTLQEIRPYQKTDRYLYEVAINVFLKTSINALKNEYFDVCKRYLASIKGTPSYAKRSQDLIREGIKRGISKLTEKHIVDLIASQEKLADRLSTVQEFVKAHFVKKKDNTLAAYTLCKGFLDTHFLQHQDYEYMLSELGFACAVANMSAQFRLVNSSITHPNVRAGLFQRTVIEFFRSKKNDEAYKWFEECAARLTQQEQKQLLFRFLAEELIREGEERALIIIGRITDEAVQAQLKRLWEDQKRHNKVQNTVSGLLRIVVHH